MSRGWGKVQRHVMAVLTRAAEQREGAWVLLRSLAGQDPSRDGNGEWLKVNTSRAEATRRAVRKLLEEGVIEKRTTHYAGKTLAVVRLRLKQTEQSKIIPKAVDQMLSTELHRQDVVHNELLQTLGSRYRRQLIARPDIEPAFLYILDDDQITYRSIFVNPPLASTEHEWWADYMLHFERLDREAGGAIHREIDLRVKNALARRGDAHCDNCYAAQRNYEQAFRQPVEEMTDRELMLEMAALTGWNAADVLVKAWREVSASTQEDDEDSASQ